MVNRGKSCGKSWCGGVVRDVCKDNPVSAVLAGWAGRLAFLFIAGMHRFYVDTNKPDK